MLLKISRIIILFLFFFSKSIAEDIPIIVISPSQKPQSKSTVGTSVTVYDESAIKQSNDYFLGDVLGNKTTSFNYFQSGGHGTSSAIQLRGLPKRYSTVYIDGVKQSDPSSVSNDFEFNHILKNQISRVEILKGNQSSVYGSGAIGGAINITTKKGKPGFHRDINYNTASHGTHNLALSMSGADEKNDFFVSLERFITDGISAMNNNDEKDGYKNSTLVANYGYKFTEKLKLDNSLRYIDTYLQYDTADDFNVFNPSQIYNDDNYETLHYLSGSMALNHKTSEQFTNKLTYSMNDIARVYNNYKDAHDEYLGERKALNYLGTYNFDLDSSVTFGIGAEFDQMDYNKGKVNNSTVRRQGFQTNSSHIDFQKRFTQNVYATLGARMDEHSMSGKEHSRRATMAYLFDDKTTKLKFSYGTGFRFPTLYEAYYVYGAHPETRKDLKAEKSEGFDLGFEKFFPDLNLNLDISYFNLKYEDALEGWSGNTRNEFWGSATYNSPSTTTSEGIEFMSKWRASDFLNLDFNYTYTSTFDGAEHDDPNKNSDFTNPQMVRVPRHFANLGINYIFPNKNLNLTLSNKISSNARDYGHVQTYDYEDRVLNSYMVNDLSLNYDLYGKYKIFFDINNIFDKKYETTLQYSQMDRSYNFGIKRAY